MQKQVVKKRGGVLRVLLILLVILLVLLADSNLRMVTREYHLSFAELPEGFDGFRIVQLSDVHGAVYGRDNERLLRAVSEAMPDMIVLTGDLADAETDLAETERLVEALAALAPVYYVSGNHEWSSGLLEELGSLFQRHGVRYLRNEYLTLEANGDRIILAGVEDPNGWKDMEKPDKLADRLREEYPEDFVLLLGHRNDWLKKYPELPVELILCGHAHGGIIRLPGVGGVLGTGFVLFPEHTEGVYVGETYQLLVSRGLGNSTIRIPRLLNNPELVVAVLEAET